MQGKEKSVICENSAFHKSVKSMDTKAFICLGSNCGDSRLALEKARGEIGLLWECCILGASSVFYTEPQDFKEQPWFANQVISVAVGDSWTPEKFLTTLLSIEKKLGRTRDSSLRYGPRIIDIDLLLYGSRKINTEFCTLPHPRMFNRAFVLVPLGEVAPELEVEGIKINDYLRNITWNREDNKIFQS